MNLLKNMSLMIAGLIFLQMLSCNTDPHDPMDPVIPPSTYIFECAIGIDSDCPINGSYYEVNPLYHPNNFYSWHFSDESIGNPYYVSSISQISANCDRIILRGQSGQIQREIPIISLNDSILVIRDEKIRPDNIILVRSQGGHYKDFYCDSTCVSGCYPNPEVVKDLCKCDEFKHGWKCSQGSFLFDFNINDYILDVFTVGKTIYTITGDNSSSNFLQNIYLSSISEEGNLNWSHNLKPNQVFDYCGFTKDPSELSLYFVDQSSLPDNRILKSIAVSYSGTIYNETVVSDGLDNDWSYKLSINSTSSIYIIGTFSIPGLPPTTETQIIQADLSGNLQASIIIPNLSISSTSIGSFDQSLNEILIYSANTIYRFSATTLAYLGASQTSYTFFNRVVKNDNTDVHEFYRPFDNNDPLSINKPDGVIFYLHNYQLFNSNMQSQQIIWTPGFIDYLDLFQNDIFKDREGNYFYVETASNTLRFGKYRNNLQQLQYNYVYPYETNLTNPFPKQLSNGDYVFFCNTKRFGSNRDILMVKFNEAGLYKYPVCQ